MERRHLTPVTLHKRTYSADLGGSELRFFRSPSGAPQYNFPLCVSLYGSAKPDWKGDIKSMQDLAINVLDYFLPGKDIIGTTGKFSIETFLLRKQLVIDWFESMPASGFNICESSLNLWAEQQLRKLELLNNKHLGVESACPTSIYARTP